MPKTTSIGELGKLYASSIREKLDLAANPKRQWILSTFSAGGVYCNETFHQVRLAGTPPTALLLLDYGCGVITGPWDVVTYCIGGCMPGLCCGGPCPLCTCCCTCLPCCHGATGCAYGDCGGLTSLGYYTCTALCCLRQCQHMRYDPRDPKNVPNQPWSHNPPETMPKPPPEAFRKGPGLQSAIDFYRASAGLDPSTPLGIPSHTPTALLAPCLACPSGGVGGSRPRSPQAWATTVRCRARRCPCRW